MKKLIVLLTATLLLVAPVTFSGCSTVNKATLKTTQAVSATADIGLSVWADYVAKEKALGTPVPLNQELQAKHAWNAFQDARDGVVKAGIAYSLAKEKNEDLSGPISALNTAAAVMAAASTDFLNLIQSFGVKL